MSLYKGYAQQRGYDPVKVPMNEAEKIRQQGLRALAQMKETYAFERNQAKQFVDAFNSNAKLEQKLFNDQTQAQKNYGELMHKAQLQNLQVSIDDAKRKSARGDQTLNNLKAIANFASQAGDAYMKVETQRRKNIDAFVAGTVTNYGLTAQQWQGLNNADSALFQNEKDLQTLLRKLEMDHVPLDVINRLRKGGGYMKYSLGLLQAKRKVDGLPAFLAQESNTPVEVEGFKDGITLNSALKNPEILPVVLAKLRSKYLSDENGTPYFDNKVLEKSGANARVREIEGEWFQRSKRLETNAFWNDRHRDVIAKLNRLTGNKEEGTTEINGASGIFKTVELLAGNPNDPNYKKNKQAALRLVSEAAVEGIKKGELRYTQITKGLEELRVGPGTGIPVKGLEGGKSVLAIKHFRKHLMPILDSAKDAEAVAQQRIERADNIHSVKGFEFAEKVQKYYASGEYNTKVTNSLLMHAMAEGNGATSGGWHKAVTLIQREQARHNNSANDAAGIAWLSNRVQGGYYVTDAEISALNMSEGATLQARQLRKKYSGLIPTEESKPGAGDGTRKQIEAFIDPLLNTLVDKKNQWGESITWNDQRIFALEQAAGFYRSFLETPGNTGNHAGAYKYTKDMMGPLMESNKGDWEVVSVNGQQEFKRALPDKRDVIEVGRGQISKELRADPTLVHKKMYFDKSALISFSSKINRGGSPSLLTRAMLIESLTDGKVLGVDAIQANLQLLQNREIALKGSSDIQLLPEWYIKKQKDLNHIIGPNGCSLGASYNLADINKACMSQKEDGSYGNPVYIKDIAGRKKAIEEHIASLTNKGEASLDPSSFEYFMLSRLENFLNKELSDSTYKNFNPAISIYRDPAFLNPEIARHLFSIGYYNQPNIEAAQ